ncbi:MAG TPA: threonine--tRNA ligase [Phycisphaerales bacterium]|nr:threonine--tRNA ligase [Phycisphaerales bacterium]
MPRITLPDGSVREYGSPVSAAQVAADIGPGLAKAAIGAKINGQLSDLSTVIDRDASLALVTSMDRKSGESSPDALYLIRHSAAHIMAEAIQRIIPGVQLVYGPPLDSGFYYDMGVPAARPIRAEDFAAIEAEMAKIIAEDRPFTRYEMPVNEGMSKLKGEGSKYKLDNAQRAIEAGSDKLSWYATGIPQKNWEDLCRGPHVPSTGRIGAFKVMSLASSYWHGDEKSDRLTRVYGTAFADKKQLDKHIAMQEEAKKRDHRIIGKQLRLFHIDEAVGQGLILWTPNGAVIRQELMNFIGEQLRRQGYHQVFTPQIGKLGLYKTSGHFPYYQDSQYPPILEHDQLAMLAKEGCSCADLSNRMKAGDIDGYLLRPMNCPHHVKIFDSAPHSYRDLPVRLCEFGTVYRWEQSGEIGGMTRVRGFTQDDAHLFCTEEQVGPELLGCLELVKIIFATLGMKDYRVRVGLRDKNSDKYIGDPKNWDKAEEACRNAAKSLDVPFTEEPGEAAFYGAKIDFIVRDVVGREWQLGTVQVDYNLPNRFDLKYIGPDNQPHRPVMIHRAPFGSFERFIGVLIEHFAGAFPTWLAPEQVRVLPISEKTADYGRRVLSDLKAIGARASIDESGERIQAKIKVATDEKIPYLLIVGPRDAEGDLVSVRARGIMHDLGSIPRTAFVKTLQSEIASRGRSSVLGEHFPNANAKPEPVAVS